MYKHASIQENTTLNVLYYQMEYVQTWIFPREWNPSYPMLSNVKRKNMQMS